ncbi:MAG: MOSC domain-containing protein [Deltaproteobacteria bacterium CG07_land_8_20_14_0_80_38_7]|nr:MAG: MOSC domain-containing protein [Deltaproteobacteria bacterium CG07_land_8_20_14_0_80_38_7]
MSNFQIISINISKKRGEKKNPVSTAELKKDFGIVNDAHADGTHRQISLLGIESIEKIREKAVEANPGDFAENITTKGINLYSLPIGTKLSLGDKVEIEITQIGKECHDRCAIFQKVGDCVMPREGVFARIIKEGIIKKWDWGKVNHAP